MTPSKLRRAGREAYEDGLTLDECPFQVYNGAESWKEGWREAEKSAKKRQEEKDKHFEANQLRYTDIKHIDTVGELLDIIDQIRDLER